MTVMAETRTQRTRLDDPLPGDEPGVATKLLATLVNRGLLADDLPTRRAALGLIDRAIAGAEMEDKQIIELLDRVEDLGGDARTMRRDIDAYLRRRATEGRET